MTNRERSPRALAAGLLVSLPFCFAPISNPDLPWHLAAGRWIAEHRAVPRADVWTWTLAGAPWMDFEWGIQLLYHALDLAGGRAALWVFKSMLFAALLALVAAMLRRWRVPDGWTALALPPLALSLLPSLDIRPENITLLFCVVQLALLESWRAGAPGGARRAFGTAFLLYALWVNLHAGFAMGLALAVVHLAGEAAERLRGPGEAGRMRAFAAWTAGALLGTALNPYGPGIWAVVLEHALAMEISRAYILEWTPATMRNLYLFPYWGLFFFSFGALLFHFLRTRATPAAHLLALAALGLASSGNTRHVPFFCLLVFPLALRAAAEVEAPPSWRRWRPAALAAAYLALAAAAAPVVARERLFRAIDDRRHEPVGAGEFLLREKGTLSALRLFNPWGWGGFVDNSLFPDYRAFVDGRYLFLPFLPEMHAARKDPSAWQAYLDRHGIGLVLFENPDRWVEDPAAGPGSGRWRALERFFMPAARWALVYWDSKALVFARRTSVPASWLAEREFQLLFPKDEPHLAGEIRARRAELSAVESEVRRYASLSADEDEKRRLAGWLAALREEPR